jgi:hypothetical protein
MSYEPNIPKDWKAAQSHFKEFWDEDRNRFVTGVATIWIVADILLYVAISALSSYGDATYEWGWDAVRGSVQILTKAQTPAVAFGWHPVGLIVLVLLNILVAAIVVVNLSD